MKNREDVMKGRQLLKVITGQPGDDVAALEAEIAMVKGLARDACVEIERLEAARRTAGSFDKARELDEALARARWQIEHADAVLPDLERRRSIAAAWCSAAAITRHHRAAERAYRKLRVAIDAAAAAQAEAIAARDAACAELGEGLAQGRIPAVAFLGLLMPDLVKIWAAEMDRAFAGPPPAAPRLPTPKPPAGPPTHGWGWTSRTQQEQQGAENPLSHCVRLDQEPPVQNKVRRPLRRDEPREGERLITILRNDIELADGSQSLAGDVITAPADRAEAMVKHGAADYFTGVPK